MTLEKSETSTFTLKSKVKEYLRQSLKDKCSTIGGRSIYFGLNDSMIRMLTPIEEVLTPVPGPLARLYTPELPFYENITKLTLPTSEDYSKRGCKDICTERSRDVQETGIGSSIDFNKTRNKSVISQSKSNSERKSKSHIKITASSPGQKLVSAGTVRIPGHGNVSRLSAQQGGDLKELLSNASKSGRGKNKPHNGHVVRRCPHKGHKITSVEVSTLRFHGTKKGSIAQGQNQSSRKKDCFDPRANYTDISGECTLPSLAKCHPSSTKKSYKTKSDGSAEISHHPPVQQCHRFLKSQHGTTVAPLPPIKFASGRDSSVPRKSTRAVKVTRSVLFHDTQEVMVTKRKQKVVDIIRNTTQLPSINDNELPDRESLDRTKSMW